MIFRASPPKNRLMSKKMKRRRQYLKADRIETRTMEHTLKSKRRYVRRKQSATKKKKKKRSLSPTREERKRIKKSKSEDVFSWLVWMQSVHTNRRRPFGGGRKMRRMTRSKRRAEAAALGEYEWDESQSFVQDQETTPSANERVRSPIVENRLTRDDAVDTYDDKDALIRYPTTKHSKAVLTFLERRRREGKTLTASQIEILKRMGISTTTTNT